MQSPGPAPDAATESAVWDIMRVCALDMATCEVGQLILMRAANHIWPNPNTFILDQQQIWAEQEAGRQMIKSSVELV
jgi:hypothetical protein